ncbi:MAG: TIGR03986 family CRISPR-associated RAMP protein [Lachnospiraceae bacterium]|nr:TIGR03986 family CRISPR-associated RAMP protein [Lachnospiraceae bacterium]
MGYYGHSNGYAKDRNHRFDGRQSREKTDNRKLNLNYEGGYLGAPYNFVPISEKTFDYAQQKKERPSHDQIRTDLYSGQIYYKITAKTPVFVGAGKKSETNEAADSFYRDSSGNFAIPGSSIRGLVRSNAQILGFSSVHDDIDDYRLMYRNVANGAEKDKYGTILGNKPVPTPSGKNITVLKNVKAGYITKEGNQYRIYRTVLSKINGALGEMNYYVASERTIIEDYRKNREKSLYSYLFSREFGHDTLYSPRAVFNREVDRGRVHYKPTDKRSFNGRQGGSYQPYYCEVSFKIHNEKNVQAIAAPGNKRQGYQNGYLLSSGAMNEKKAIYLIPSMDETSFYPISPSDVDAYKRDFEGKKNQLGKNADFYALPENGEVKPVFYIELDGRLYFGFTPRLRLFYEKTIKEGLVQKETAIDYCKALFGTAEKNQSYKSRLSFVNACTNAEKEMSPVTLVLGSPKPTSYLDYLEHATDKTKIATYNDNFRLRGRKQYWLKQRADCGCSPGELAEKKVGSQIRPLPAGTVFQGKIVFKNLSKDELGLLIWSLELNQESEQNIGKAKAYGYGRVKIQVTGVELFNEAKAYDMEAFEFHPFEQAEKEPFISSYQTEISKWLGKPISQVPEIMDFFLMKNSEKIPDASKTRYMSIDKKEYQNRVSGRAALPKIKEIIKSR